MKHDYKNTMRKVKMLLPSPCSALHPNAPFLDENLKISRVNENIYTLQKQTDHGKIEYEEIINAPSFPYTSFLKAIVKFNVMRSNGNKIE